VLGREVALFVVAENLVPRVASKEIAACQQVEEDTAKREDVALVTIAA